ISDHLKNFLTPQDDNKDSEDDSKGLPGALAPIENAISELREWRNSPRRVGITQTAPAVSLRNEVASEIGRACTLILRRQRVLIPPARMKKQKIRIRAWAWPPPMTVWNRPVPVAR